MNDLTDAVKWASGKASPIPSGSPSGPAHLAATLLLRGLTLHPESLCCGVDVVGPADLATL